MIRTRMQELQYKFNFLQFHLVHLRSRRRIEKWQNARVTALVGYLAKNIPLYKRLLGDRGIAIDTIREVADLQRLPILNKKMFIGKNVDEYTDASSFLYGTWATTSGSTGVPFSPLRRSIAYMPFYRDSFRYRFILDKLWNGFSIDWARVAHIRIDPIYRDSHIVVSVEDVLNAPEKAMRELVGHAPDIIESYPSALFELAQYVTSQGPSFTVPYIITSGEKITPLLRSTIERDLGGELFDRYGLEEFGTVGTECDTHDGYHVNVESFIVEIVDDAGNVVPDGRSGRILITDLYNYQMPFVRYDTGDHGRISWGECACGLEAVRVWPEGRDSAVITLSVSGRKYHHFEFSESLKSFMNHILQFQIEKVSERTIVVRIVPGPLFDVAVERAAQQKVSELVGEDVEVVIERVQAIKKMPRGKIQVVVDSTVA